MQSIEIRTGHGRGPVSGPLTGPTSGPFGGPAAGRVSGRSIVTAVLVALLLVSGAASLWAAAPAGYYDTVNTANASTLRQTVHDVIKDHTRYPYSSSTEIDTWDILELAQEDPNDANRIIDVYKNASYAKGDTAYNREHTWPKSYGFPVDGPDNYPYTDCHHIFLSDVAYNAERSNKPFRYCSGGCAEWTTDVNDGRGGGSGVYPGNSNWTEGAYSTGTWEAWNGRKGDVARAILYMDVRYEGGVNGITGTPEPDLRLTDDDALIDSYRTGSNEPVAYMGILSDLLQWAQEDPVDAREMHHNDVVYAFQGNRNPFVDHPEWVACVYQNICSGGDTTAPSAPTGLVAVGGSGSVDLLWNANSENDLAGYHVYRATNAGGPYGRVDSQLVTTSSFTDTTVTGGTTYYYVVTAVDTSSNESMTSAEASATPDGGTSGGGTVILSEVFYDPSGSDSGLEWVELYNPGTTTVDLSGFSLGNGGLDYTTSLVQLSGTIAPGATFVVGGPSSSSANGYPSFGQAIDFNPDFQNSGSTGDGVALFGLPAAQVTASTVPVDAVVYGPNNNNGLIDETGAVSAPEVGDAPSGSSIERVDLAGSWQIQATPTPNTTPIVGGGGGGGTDVVILSEVFYDPSGSDSGLEWVELYNPGTTTVDLSGFSLGNGGLDYTTSLVQLSGTIAPGATFVVGGPSSSSANGYPSFGQAIDFNPDFQNSGSTGDGVALFGLPAAQVTASTVPVDAVVYGPNNNNGLIDETGAVSAPEVGDAPSGSSIERVDLAGSWQIQATPTPNTTPL